ncbi:RDD family protein [Pengzhenrongella frigida]|nr:RDD family protein [Cellulomonas sp. HLT2-17]
MSKRLLAFVIDQAAYLIVGGGIVLASGLDQIHSGATTATALVPSTPLALAGYGLILGLALFQWWYQGTRGFTLGKRAVGLRTLAAATGQPAGLMRILLRQLVVMAGSLVFGIGQAVVYASPFLDAGGWRQGWHDKAAGTIVFDVAVGRDPATADAGVGAPRSARTYDDGPGRTAPQPLVASAVAVSTPPPWAVRPAVAPALDDEVELTRLTSTDAVATPLLTPARRVGPPRMQAVLQLWDGRTVVLEGTALIGRNPAPRPGEAPPSQLLAAVDPGRSVSKTHLAIGVEADGVWLRDRNSTNGTVVTLHDGAQILCAAEQRVRIPAGSSVAFGDFWLAVVEEG